MAKRKNELELLNDKLTDNKMREQVFQSVARIGQFIKADQSKHINIDEGGMGGGADAKSQNMIGHMIMQYQAISNAT